MPDRQPFVVEPMGLNDLDQLMEIEKVSFSAPWSVRAYRFELTQNEHSTFLVVRPRHQIGERPSRWRSWLRRPLRGPVLGYAGFWLLVDEAHIATIAVHPEWRGRGLGELLLLSLLEQAIQRGAQRATLEVRLSNQAAQRLYRKYNFEVVALRPRYYADNNEDAYLMATPPFETPAFQANLERRRARLLERLAQESVESPLLATNEPRPKKPLAG